MSVVLNQTLVNYVKSGKYFEKISNIEAKILLSKFVFLFNNAIYI